MRKIIHRYTVLLLTVLLVGTGIALADTDVIVLGDVNSDGSVNATDVTALVNYLHGSGTVNEVAADVNRDGAIDIADVTAINNIISNGTFNKGTASTLFFRAATVNKSYGDATFKNQLVRSGSTGAITYTSSATGVATVNTTTGDVTIQGAGTTIITATLAGNGGITGTNASYTLYVGQAAASITTSPASVAGDLTYDGTAQNLVTAGDASGGTLKYFVNTSGEVPTTETDGWTDVVSTGTDADTYYVWYYVAGDANHTNTAVTAIEGNTKAISKFNLTNAAIATEIGDQQYAGAQVTPAAPAIKLGESTIDASNYDVSYGENNSVGTGTVIYTAKAGSANFSGAKIVNFTITSGTLSVTAEDYSGTYDGAAHGITVTCDGATIKYRTTAEGEYNLTENPTYTNAGTVQTVYYQVTKDNYTTVEGSKTVTITQKEVTVSDITASNKTYDGTTTATLVYTGATISGKVGSDELTVTATGTFDDANVGTDKTVTISDITLGGSSAANYKLATSGNQTSTTANITAASFTPVVTLSGWTYGSPNDPSVGETNTSGGTVTYYYKTGDAEWTTTQPTDAGTHQVKASIAASGNYAAAESSPVDFTITQKEVTVSGITASNKTYDGNTTATLVYTSVSIDGKVGEDDLTVTATGTFDDANVGTGKTVTISGITLGGSSAANYKLAASGNQTSTTANITVASFTPVVTLSGWTYGSPNDPSVGETNTSGGTVTYYYKTGDAEWTTTQPTDAGTHKVKASIAANGNYAAAESAEVEFTVTQKALTITAKAQTISYGSSIATGTGQVTADGLVAGDALTAVILAASTDQVTTSGIITPSAATTTKGIGNYSVTYNTGTLTINKVAASVTTAPMGKTSLTYTGEAQELVDATSAASTGGTLVYSKTENGTYGAASTITETNAGTYSFWYKVLGDGNHDDSTPVQITGVVIGKKEVTVSGITAENKTYDGTTTATLVYTGATITGKVGSDELTVTATGTFEDANVGTGKTVTISGITLGGAKAGNYILAATGNQTSTTANIIYTSMSDATQDDIGKVICSNGHIHSNVSDVTCGGSASAMIAYVGNQNNANGNGAYSSTYNHGLAIALADVINTSGNLQTAASHTNYLTWENAKTACSSFKGSKPSGVTWMLPSAYQWERMLIGCGSTATYVAYSSQSFGSFSYGNFRTKLTSCGNNTQGVYDVQSSLYWSSTVLSSNADGAWGYYFNDSRFDYGGKTYSLYVRACYAF